MDHGWLGRLAAERNVSDDSGIGAEINSSICCSTLYHIKRGTFLEGKGQIVVNRVMSQAEKMPLIAVRMFGLMFPSCIPP